MNINIILIIILLLIIILECNNEHIIEGLEDGPYYNQRLISILSEDTLNLDCSDFDRGKMDYSIDNINCLEHNLLIEAINTDSFIDHYIYLNIPEEKRKEYINEEDYPREYYINQYIQTLFDGGKKYTLLQRYNILKDYISYYDSQELGITSDIGIGIFNKVNQKYITLLLRNKLDLINDEKNEYMNKINTQNSKNELKRYGEYDNINDSIVTSNNLVLEKRNPLYMFTGPGTAIPTKVNVNNIQLYPLRDLTITIQDYREDSDVGVNAYPLCSPIGDRSIFGYYIATVNFRIDDITEISEITLSGCRDDITDTRIRCGGGYNDSYNKPVPLNKPGSNNNYKRIYFRNSKNNCKLYYDNISAIFEQIPTASQEKLKEQFSGHTNGVWIIKNQEDKIISFSLGDDYIEGQFNKATDIYTIIKPSNLQPWYLYCKKDANSPYEWTLIPNNNTDTSDPLYPLRGFNVTHGLGMYPQRHCFNGVKGNQGLEPIIEQYGLCCNDDYSIFSRDEKSINHTFNTCRLAKTIIEQSHKDTKTPMDTYYIKKNDYNQTPLYRLTNNIVTNIEQLSIEPKCKDILYTSDNYFKCCNDKDYLDSLEDDHILNRNCSLVYDDDYYSQIDLSNLQPITTITPDPPSL